MFGVQISSFHGKNVFAANIVWIGKLPNTKVVSWLSLVSCRRLQEQSVKYCEANTSKVVNEPPAVHHVIVNLIIYLNEIQCTLDFGPLYFPCTT